MKYGRSLLLVVRSTVVGKRGAVVLRVEAIGSTLGKRDTAIVAGLDRDIAKDGERGRSGLGRSGDGLNHGERREKGEESERREHLERVRSWMRECLGRLVRTRE
jgi:hypothetical protein